MRDVVQVFYKKFGDPMKGADEGIDKAINESLARIRTEAVDSAPVKSGDLRLSMTYKGPNGEQEGPGGLTEKLKKHQGVVGSPLYYASYVNFGTRKQRPQPFFSAAVALEAGRSKTEVIKKINESMNKWVKGKVTIVKF